MRNLTAEEARRVTGVLQGRLNEEREERAAERAVADDQRLRLEATVDKLGASLREQERRWAALEAALVRTDTRAATEAEDRGALGRRLEEHVSGTSTARATDARDWNAALVAERDAAMVREHDMENDMRQSVNGETAERVALAVRVSTERAEVNALVAGQADSTEGRCLEASKAEANAVRHQLDTSRADTDATVAKHDNLLRQLSEEHRPAVNQRLDHIEERVTRDTLRLKSCEKGVDELMVGASRTDAAARALEGKVTEGFAGAMAAVAEAHNAAASLRFEHDNIFDANATSTDELRDGVRALESRAVALDSSVAELHSRAVALDAGREVIQEHMRGSLDAIKHVDASLEADLRRVSEQQQSLALELAAYREVSSLELKREAEAREGVAWALEREGVERRAAHQAQIVVTCATLETQAQRLSVIEDDYTQSRIDHEHRLAAAEGRGESLEANIFSSERAGRQRLVELMGAIREQFETKLQAEAGARVALESTLQAAVTKHADSGLRRTDSLETAVITTGDALSLLRQGMLEGHERLESLIKESIAVEAKARRSMEAVVEQRLGFVNNPSL
mmetsp:Transcript_5951/g.15151  ORF Transcript_5951/g.15151 Transcript_5951/m.15151 type:complete len:571 (+) Transcript_5951:609-2321(+)